MNSFSVESSQASDELIVNALNDKGIAHNIKGMRYLNDHGQEIAEGDIDNGSGDPALMLAGVIVDLECETDEATLDSILNEVADYEGVTLAVM